MPPSPGDIIFNEYVADNNSDGNDFFELLVIGNNVDLRGLRVSDNIVLTQLLDSLGYNGTNAIADNFVRIVQGSSSTDFNVQIDSDGQAGGDIFRQFITVNLASTSTGTLNDARNFIF